jgi:hypothetical protein
MDCSCVTCHTSNSDGPWDKMQEFDDGLPQRHFDNFQFVEMAKGQFLLLFV